MEGNTKNDEKSDKEKFLAIKGLLRPRKRRFYKNENEPSQEVIFHVRDNSELRYVVWHIRY